VKTLVKYILLAIGGLLFIDTVWLSFASNFNLGLVLQGAVALGAIIYALYLKKIPKAAHITVGALCLLPLAFAGFLAIYGNSDNAGFDEDVVIVLGAGVRGERVSVPLALRLDEAVRYHAMNPEAVIAVCGGQGFQEDITEALAMERYLISKGIPPEKIVKEEKSTSTYENFAFAREILKSTFPQGFSSVLITNGFHVYRAVKLAQYAGVSAKHIGARAEWHTIPVNYLREMLAVMKMWVMPPEAVSVE
jgi:uncharacterized SAM-binding protein YcdF (DUF218 family)